MKAAILHQYEGPEELKLGEVPDPQGQGAAEKDDIGKVLPRA